MASPQTRTAEKAVLRLPLRSRSDIEALEQRSATSILSAATIYDAIAATAGRTPDKPALRHLVSANTSDAPRDISYADLLDQVERAANVFRAASAHAARTSVSIILPMLPEALIATWAGATAGIANPINPYLEIHQVAAIMNAAQSTVLVTTTSRFGPGAWDKLEQLKASVPSLKRVLLVGADAGDDDFATALRSADAGLSFEPSRDPLADAIYLPTGGTTAAPKLVRMNHRGQLLAAWNYGAISGPEEDGVIGHAMPNFHVGGSVLLALRAMLFGQTLLTLTTDGFRNPGVVKNFWSIARHFRMTCLIATPATAAAILALPPDVKSDGHCIRNFSCGGSTIPVELLRAFHARYGIWLRELWGMSEIHGAVSGHPDDGNEPVAGSVGIHFPWHPVKAVEVDEHNRFVRECAPGERGVLAIGGPGVTPGYVDARLDKDFFIAGMPDGQRWANTGDLGTVDERGYIWMFGRAKDVIVRGGHNIDPKMIEEVLVCHPAVQIAAAIGRPDPAKGEMPIAYVQLKEGHSVDCDELLALCRRDVQERAAVPAEIVVTPQMPMTAVGKINKPALRVDAMRTVSLNLTTQVVAQRGTCEVSVDESGLRPCVKIRVSLDSDSHESVAAQLAEAFKTYEFQTRIDVMAR